MVKSLLVAKKLHFTSGTFFEPPGNIVKIKYKQYQP